MYTSWLYKQALFSVSNQRSLKLYQAFNDWIKFKGLILILKLDKAEVTNSPFVTIGFIITPPLRLQVSHEETC